MVDASRKPPMRAPFVLFTVCALGGGIAGLCELPFRIHLTKGPILGATPDIFLKAILFAGFYACVYGVIGSIIGLVLNLVKPGVLNGRLAVLATWLLAVVIVVQYVSVPINRQLPPLSHPKSLFTNAGLVFGALALALLFFRITGKKLSAVTPKQGERTEKILFAIALLLCGSGIFLGVAFHFKHAKPGQIGERITQGPNVLLVTVDTLRADHLSAYGYPHMKTKTVDALSQQGILFENAFSTTSWTLPACATILTGRTPRACHVQKMDDQIPDQVTTLAEAMAESGRMTAAVTSNVFLTPVYGFDRGFEKFVNVYDKSLRPALSGIYLFDHFFRLAYSLDDASNVTKLAVSQLENLKGHSFFMWVHYMDPHKPYGGPWPLVLPEYDKGYDGSINFIYGWKEPINELLEPLTEDDLRHVRALYDADIERFDRFFGDLLNEMKKRGMLENTIIALTADHGEEFLEHGDFGHGKNLHVQETQIPLILAGSEIPKGIRLPERVSLLDLPKTLCMLAGFAPPASFQGQMLLDRVESNPGLPAFSELQFKGRQEFALRFTGEDEKTLSFISDMRSGEELLFDLSQDPDEKSDIAHDQSQVFDKAAGRLQKRIHRENVAAKSVKRSKPVALDRDYRHVLQELGYLGD